MSFRSHPFRSATTGIGILLFALLAVGSLDDDDDYVPQTAPEEVGKQDAMAWAESNSAALASKVQEVQTARSEALGEVYRLESLKGQFPEQATRISASMAAWRQAMIKLDTAMSDVEQRISEAYVASQVGAPNDDQLLQDIAENWTPVADAALRESRALRESSPNNN